MKLVLAKNALLGLVVAVGVAATVVAAEGGVVVAAAVEAMLAAAEEEVVVDAAATVVAAEVVAAKSGSEMIAVKVDTRAAVEVAAKSAGNFPHKFRTHFKTEPELRFRFFVLHPAGSKHLNS
jgi:hypothetical protein